VNRSQTLVNQPDTPTQLVPPGAGTMSECARQTCGVLKDISEPAASTTSFANPLYQPYTIEPVAERAAPVDDAAVPMTRSPSTEVRFT
jgi:hypothetical protein